MAVRAYVDLLRHIKTSPPPISFNVPLNKSKDKTWNPLLDKYMPQVLQFERLTSKNREQVLLFAAKCYNDNISIWYLLVKIDINLLLSAPKHHHTILLEFESDKSDILNELNYFATAKQNKEIGKLYFSTCDDNMKWYLIKNHAAFLIGKRFPISEFKRLCGGDNDFISVNNNLISNVPSDTKKFIHYDYLSQCQNINDLCFIEEIHIANIETDEDLMITINDDHFEIDISATIVIKKIDIPVFVKKISE